MQFRFIFAAVAILAAGSVSAASVAKCVGADGGVTFSQHGCPHSSVSETAVSATNQAPSGSGAPVVMAAPVTIEPRKGSIVSGIDHAPRVIEAPPAPPIPAATAGGGQPAENQPCIRIVEQLRRSARRNADGSTRVRSEIVKVPVAC